MQPVKRNERRNGLSVLGQDIRTKLMEWDGAIRRFIDDLKYKLNHLPQTNFELGKRFADEGRVKDALFRFKMATYFAPDYTQAWYNLGCCQLANDDKQRAMASLKRTLQLDPAHADAKFMLATIDPNLLAPPDRPAHMPSHMVEGFFARVADQYDMIEGASGYTGPQEFHKLIMAALRGRTLVRMLDLGCGTGLAAMPFRKEVQSIVGVDITPAMATRASYARLGGVPLYDEVLTLDANKPQPELPAGNCDLVVALNVLPYLGECSAFIQNAARALHEGGALAVTFDPLAQASGYGVLPATSRFGHGVEYVRGLAHAAGLETVGQDTLQLYTNTKTLFLLFSKTKV